MIPMKPIPNDPTHALPKGTHTHTHTHSLSLSLSLSLSQSSTPEKERNRPQRTNKQTHNTSLQTYPHAQRQLLRKNRDISWYAPFPIRTPLMHEQLAPPASRNPFSKKRQFQLSITRLCYSTIAAYNVVSELPMVFLPLCVILA
jgi:hypothetical protein